MTDKSNDRLLKPIFWEGTIFNECCETVKTYTYLCGIREEKGKLTENTDIIKQAHRWLYGFSQRGR